MTVLEVKNQLVTHFLTHSTFDPVKHAFEITYDKDTADFREQLCAAALKELEGQGFLRPLVKGDKTIWVLNQPINSFPQQVVISPMLADMMANVVNFHNDLDELDYVVDSTKIDEAVIARMINIISEYDDAEFGDGEANGKEGDE